MNDFLREDLNKLRPYNAEIPTYKYKMDANESPWDIPKSLREILARELIEGFEFNRYPDSDSKELANSIARYCQVSADNVIVGAGSDELIQVIINAFVSKGDSVIFPTPSFAMYNIFTIISGGNPIPVPLNSEYDYNLDEFSHVGVEHRPKLAILCSPNNPTGNIIKTESVEKFIKNFPGIVVIDEAYGEFSRETAIGLIDQYPNLIVLRTLSKAFGMAGLRIGYSLCSKDLALQIKTVKPPYNLNSFSQRVGILALENSNIMKERVDLIKGQRELVYNRLKNLKGVKVYPSEGNFLLFKIKLGDVVYQRLLEEGFLLRGYSGDKYLNESLRVTICDEATNTAFLDTLEKIIEEMGYV